VSQPHAQGFGHLIATNVNKTLSTFNKKTLVSSNLNALWHSKDGLNRRLKQRFIELFFNFELEAKLSHNFYLNPRDSVIN